MMRKLLTALALLIGFAAVAQVTTVDPARLLKPSGSANRLLITNASTATAWSDANIEWDPSNLEFRIGQPISGATARLQAKGAGGDASTYILQGYSSGDAEIFRMSNDGFYQGAGIANVGVTYGGTFQLKARIYQPTTVVSTITSGAGTNFLLSGGFAPTSGTAQYTFFEINGDVNQTGGANGKTRGLLINNNLVSAANYWGLETVGGKSIFGNGATYPEVPARLNVVGLGNTSSTRALDVYNTSGTILFAVRDDGNVGVKTATPGYTLDLSAAVDGLRLPVGTTANRPTGAAGLMRMNTDVDVIEWHDGTDWQSINPGGGGGAPVDAQYVTLAANGTLSAERVLTAGTNVTLTDAGANSTITVAALTEQFVHGGIITASQLTADAHDYAPTGLSTASVVRVSTDATFRRITGLTGGAAGRRVVLSNVGSYVVMLKHESSQSSASNRFDFDTDDIFIFPKQSVEVMYDATLSRWTCVTRPSVAGDLDYATIAFWRHGVTGSTGTSAGDFWSKSNSGGSGSGQGSSPFASSGISTSSSATGRGSIGSPANWINPSATTYLNCLHSTSVNVLSDGTNTYTLRIGWSGTTNPAGDPTNGVYFRYTHSVNSGNWEFVCRASSSETVINCGSGPTTSSGSPVQLRVVIDPGAARAEGFIDGVSVGVTTTNIPTSGLGTICQIAKTAGTTARTLLMTGASFKVISNKRN